MKTEDLKEIKRYCPRQECNTPIVGNGQVVLSKERLMFSKFDDNNVAIFICLRCGKTKEKFKLTADQESFRPVNEDWFWILWPVILLAGMIGCAALTAGRF